jgi:integrase/recombinase XerD
LKKDRVAIASGSEHQVEVLTEGQVDKLLFHLEQPVVSLRNRLIAYLLLYTGVRVSELVNIKLNDIDVLTQTLTVRGKGGKVREISLRQDVMRLIQEYRTGERNKSSHKDSNYLQGKNGGS